MAEEREWCGCPMTARRRFADRKDGRPVFRVRGRAEYERLSAKGVRFLQPPVDHGTVVTAVLDDTCGNLVQICEEKRK